jgi:5-(carboxyamino)imidazole ribonucleotide synthase
MSAMAAYRLGFEVAILDKEQYSPAGQLTRHEFIGSVDDDDLLKRFSDACHVITLENEFVDYRRLEFLEKLGKKVHPGSRTIALIQDKLLQKNALRKKGIPVADFLEVKTASNLLKIIRKLSIPFVLKSRKMGYDGYGNALVSNKQEFDKAYEALTSRHAHLFAEQFIDFQMELAVMVARTSKETRVYPVVQTLQRGHICHTVIAPAHIEKKVTVDAQEIAVECVKAVHGIGLFGIEMFLTRNNRILVNEMAPRPHNSGHYSIEGCTTSQFENHIRSVMQFPLGSTDMVKSYAVMVNLLGSKDPSPGMKKYTTALRHHEAHLHIYGKHESRVGRKMGHVTILGHNPQQLLKQAKKIESTISL